MNQPAYEVADIIERNRKTLSSITANRWKLRTLYALANCRTSALGYHIDKCDNPDCNHIHISYNSCRNRHCPKCQGHKREQWIYDREKELLNVPYYHIVFTLPEQLNILCLQKTSLMYEILFKVSWSVVKDFALNPKFIGGKTGMIGILHTWGQNLSFHPHLHCIVPGGGITATGKWKHARGKDKYLFPVKAMSKVFRARFVGEIRKLQNEENKDLYQKLFTRQWVVYCKRPFFGPKQVVEYLGRYTHKIAISNHRIKNTDNNTVRFSAKDYRKGGQKTEISLSDREFIRRFSLHILPKGFTRIRHYGILSSAIKKLVIPTLQSIIGQLDIKPKRKTLYRCCPCCKTGQLITLATYKPRGPPHKINLICAVS